MDHSVAQGFPTSPEEIGDGILALARALFGRKETPLVGRQAVAYVNKRGRPESELPNLVTVLIHAVPGLKIRKASLNRAGIRMQGTKVCCVHDWLPAVVGG